MKLFITGYVLGVLSVLAYNLRAKWFPRAKAEANREIDQLLKRKDGTP